MTTAQPAFATCDLCDAHKNDTSDGFRVFPPVFQHYGQKQKFAGPVSTVKCFEDNTLVKQAVDSPGQGRVLVVDGGGIFAQSAGRRESGSGCCAQWLGRAGGLGLCA